MVSVVYLSLIRKVKERLMVVSQAYGTDRISSLFHTAEAVINSFDIVYSIKFVSKAWAQVLQIALSHSLPLQQKCGGSVLSVLLAQFQNNKFFFLEAKHEIKILCKIIIHHLQAFRLQSLHFWKYSSTVWSSHTDPSQCIPLQTLLAYQLERTT